MIPIQATTLLGALWPAAPEDRMISCVVTDSREVKPGCVFVAIKGARADGHDFAAGAIRDGAEAVVVQHPVDGVPVERTILVGDPLDAMIEMGANYRRLFSPIVLGVTGSVGKTTTKEFCATVFSAFGQTLKTEGNQNNEIGMPNTLFKLDEDVQYAVIEMGMQGLGEIHKLSVAAAPAGAIITKIGTAHMEALGSKENILRAKMEICDGLAPGAPLVINGDDELLCAAEPPEGVYAVRAGIYNEDCEVRAKNIHPQDEGVAFTIRDAQFGSHPAYIPVIGEHNVYDALFAYTAATRLGLAPSHVAAALRNFKTTGMRQNIVQVGGVTLVEDCYNASPESVAAALQALGEMPVTGRRIAVLGDMLELGDAAHGSHVQLGDECKANGVAAVITVGQLAQLGAQRAAELGLMAYKTADNAAAAQKLLALAQPGDAVLVKASRGMRFEEILEAFKAAKADEMPAE